MSIPQRIGIIDIGSNSIRLVIYEQNALGGCRVVTEHKQSARLSERISADGRLPTGELDSVVELLQQFALICSAYEVAQVRAVATAAIRNAANSAEIAAELTKRSGIVVEVLSGAEEGRYGFLGVINAIDVQDGFIVDIGGGSTEVTLFRGRTLLHSVSFPFGSVNTTRQHARGGVITEQGLAAIRQMVGEAVASQPWIGSAPGLPLIGLGGTIRNLGKMSQRRRKHSLPLAHNYELKAGELDAFLKQLAALPLDKRKKVDGLSKDRADLIVPGLAILQAIFAAAGAAHLIVSGSGLRDGLVRETLHPEQPVVDDVLEASIENLLLLHHGGVAAHVRQVSRLALALFDALGPAHGLSARDRHCLRAAALLHRIGATVSYYQYAKHTQYIIAQARIDGCTHREIALISLIAAYKTKSRAHQNALAYKDVLNEPGDEELIARLGTLLQLAVALDRSETQPVRELQAAPHAKALELTLQCSHPPAAELAELAGQEKEFHKIWGRRIKCRVEVSSRP
ncbi:Ppx/GppA family phosphatase [Paenibacillus athensensis]|uniref:Phosphatase n=1 Tax=Paenibacillus athensensis TaxID=1967502 RepID=A0A4Y8Q908_9BACL|nr:Ppx/GppA phosphatase family protein [Paenibacillus athensensis]MCD1258900.1 Ppx/GppA family phosphatase [Paenibacillus athensensis]